MKEYEASVALPFNWSKLFAPEEFYSWAQKNNIGESDWNFDAGPAFSSPTMWFTKPEDALAFKLKFGL
jgi:hypothetical protein